MSLATKKNLYSNTSPSHSIAEAEMHTALDHTKKYQKEIKAL